MSKPRRVRRPRVRKKAIAVPCVDCGSASGYPCRTRGTRANAMKPHSARRKTAATLCRYCGHSFGCHKPTRCWGDCPCRTYRRAGYAYV